MFSLSNSSRRLLGIFSFVGALGVCFGAFGAHALKSRVSPEDLTIWATSTQYLFYHVFAGILCSCLDQKLAPKLFLAGILIFSGSLYTLVLTQVRWLGAITPIGGVLFILGWVVFAASSFKTQEKK